MMDHPGEAPIVALRPSQAGLRADPGRLVRAVGALIEPGEVDTRSLWDRLSGATGVHVQGSGHPTAKSRPPATLACVALVIDITRAAREGAEDLAGRVFASVPSNLYAIVDALDLRPDDDLIDWWADSSNEWTNRARMILGQTPQLLASMHGAVCPYCRATTVRSKHQGEWWVIPAIHVQWDSSDTVAQEYQIHSVHCRACNARWSRGTELDALVDQVIRNNYASETQALTD
jgi:hypothetical protein